MGSNRLRGPTRTPGTNAGKRWPFQKHGPLFYSLFLGRYCGRSDNFRLGSQVGQAVPDVSGFCGLVAGPSVGSLARMLDRLLNSSSSGVRHSLIYGLGLAKAVAMLPPPRVIKIA